MRVVVSFTPPTFFSREEKDAFVEVATSHLQVLPLKVMYKYECF
jgi:hypothetical protein